MARTVEFVERNGTTLRVIDAAESTRDGDRWVRPDGVAYRNQHAAADPAYRAAVENALAWFGGAVPDHLADVESTPSDDGGWTDPRGRAWHVTHPSETMRAAADGLILSEIVPPTREQHAATLDHDAAADNSARDGNATVATTADGR